MTVQELIEALQKLEKPNAEALVESDAYPASTLLPITGIGTHGQYIVIETD